MRREEDAAILPQKTAVEGLGLVLHVGFRVRTRRTHISGFLGTKALLRKVLGDFLSL